VSNIGQVLELLSLMRCASRTLV